MLRPVFWVLEAQRGPLTPRHDCRLRVGASVGIPEPPMEGPMIIGAAKANRNASPLHQANGVLKQINTASTMGLGNLA